MADWKQKWISKGTSKKFLTTVFEFFIIPWHPYQDHATSQDDHAMILPWSLHGDYELPWSYHVIPWSSCLAMAVNQGSLFLRSNRTSKKVPQFQNGSEWRHAIFSRSFETCIVLLVVSRGGYFAAADFIGWFSISSCISQSTRLHCKTDACKINCKCK